MEKQKEFIESIWEEAEGKKPKELSEEEKRNALLEEYGEDPDYGPVQTEFGILDLSEDAMKDVIGGKKLTYDQYAKALFNSRNERRANFEYCYYTDMICEFKGTIERFSKDKVLFSRIYILGDFEDGTLWEGSEDHVWMTAKPFKDFKAGDMVSFDGQIYRYLKTGNGLSISFGIEPLYVYGPAETYELPSEEKMNEQAVNQIICEVCKFKNHCYMGNCIANEEWVKGMKKLLLGKCNTAENNV